MDTERVKIVKKISWAIKNRESLSKYELKAVYDEAIAFKKTLPYEKRSAFGWKNCLEMLAMLAN